MRDKVLRKRLLKLLYDHNEEHVGSCFTCLDIIDKIFERKNKDDIFILSNGHAAYALYCILEKYCNEIIPLLNELQTKVIINIAGSAMKDYLETMEMLESKNGKHVGYEINISCPNVKEGGIEFGVNCEMTEQLTIAMRKRTDKLLIMKLSPNVTRIEDIAQAAESGGADAVSAINTVGGMAIDLKTRRPKLNTTFGGLSGPAIKPIAIANVHKIFKAVNIPIIGIGGITTAKDVVEFLLAGATMVQIGTMNYQNPNLGIQLKGELSEYYSQNDIEKIEDLIGKVEYHSN